MLFLTPTEVELLVCMGDRPWGHFILMRVWRRGNISLEVINIAAISDPAAEDSKNLIIWAMVRIGSLNCDLGSSLERKILDPAWIRALETLR